MAHAGSSGSTRSPRHQAMLEYEGAVRLIRLAPEGDVDTIRLFLGKRRRSG